MRLGECTNRMIPDLGTGERNGSCLGCAWLKVAAEDPTHSTFCSFEAENSADMKWDIKLNNENTTNLDLLSTVKQRADQPQMRLITCLRQQSQAGSNQEYRRFLVSCPVLSSLDHTSNKQFYSLLILNLFIPTAPFLIYKNVKLSIYLKLNPVSL